MKLLTLLLSLCICSTAFSQRTKDLKTFKHHSVVTNKDTINYHTYAKKDIESTNVLLLYIQGSKAMSLYQTMEENGKRMLEQHCLLILTFCLIIIYLL